MDEFDDGGFDAMMEDRLSGRSGFEMDEPDDDWRPDDRERFGSDYGTGSGDWEPFIPQS